MHIMITGTYRKNKKLAELVQQQISEHMDFSNQIFDKARKKNVHILGLRGRLLSPNWLSSVCAHSCLFYDTAILNEIDIHSKLLEKLRARKKPTLCGPNICRESSLFEALSGFGIKIEDHSGQIR